VVESAGVTGTFRLGSDAVSYHVIFCGLLWHIHFNIFTILLLCTKPVHDEEGTARKEVSGEARIVRIQ
jgi:hypothetical protein